MSILILDGGLGTTLEQNHGVSFHPGRPLWSSHLLISDPATLAQCQRSFGQVPVDIIQTATYQASLAGFAQTKTRQHPHGITSRCAVVDLLDAAVRLASSARSTPTATVGLSIGPYGACMTPSAEYSGVYDVDALALEEWHVERMQLLAEVPDLATRVSYLCVETVPRVDEIKAVRRALDRVPLAGPAPCWISCLFPADERMPDGSSPEEAVRAMLDPAVARCVPWGVGVNCTKVGVLDAVVRRYEAEVGRMVQQGSASWPALVLYPDGTDGQVYDTLTQRWRDGGPRGGGESWEGQLARVARDALARGRWTRIVVGGCCMAKPDDIRRLRTCLQDVCTS